MVWVPPADAIVVSEGRCGIVSIKEDDALLKREWRGRRFPLRREEHVHVTLGVVAKPHKPGCYMSCMGQHIPGLFELQLPHLH